MFVSTLILDLDIIMIILFLFDVSIVIGISAGSDVSIIDIWWVRSRILPGRRLMLDWRHWRRGHSGNHPAPRARPHQTSSSSTNVHSTQSEDSVLNMGGFYHNYTVNNIRAFSQEGDWVSNLFTTLFGSWVISFQKEDFNLSGKVCLPQDCV